MLLIFFRLLMLLLLDGDCIIAVEATILPLVLLSFSRCSSELVLAELSGTGLLRLKELMSFWLVSLRLRIAWSCDTCFGESRLSTYEWFGDWGLCFASDADFPLLANCNGDLILFGFGGTWFLLFKAVRRTMLLNGSDFLFLRFCEFLCVCSSELNFWNEASEERFIASSTFLFVSISTRNETLLWRLDAVRSFAFSGCKFTMGSKDVKFYSISLKSFYRTLKVGSRRLFEHPTKKFVLRPVCGLLLIDTLNLDGSLLDRGSFGSTISSLGWQNDGFSSSYFVVLWIQLHIILPCLIIYSLFLIDVCSSKELLNFPLSLSGRRAFANSCWNTEIYFNFKAISSWYWSTDYSNFLKSALSIFILYTLLTSSKSAFRSMIEPSSSWLKNCSNWLRTSS